MVSTKSNRWTPDESQSTQSPAPARGRLEGGSAGRMRGAGRLGGSGGARARAEREPGAQVAGRARDQAHGAAGAARGECVGGRSVADVGGRDACVLRAGSVAAATAITACAEGHESAIAPGRD